MASSFLKGLVTDYVKLGYQLWHRPLKMASLVYEREIGLDDTHPKSQRSSFGDISDGCARLTHHFTFITQTPNKKEEYSQEIPEVIQKLLQVFRLCQVGFLAAGFLLQATP